LSWQIEPFLVDGVIRRDLGGGERAIIKPESAKVLYAS
jgi:hypothetical protein